MTFTWRRGAAYLLIRYERTVREALRNPIQVLSSLTEKSKNESYRFQRLYRNLYNPEFYWLAYKNIYANTGSMTAGADGTTIDGMSDERIQRIIESMRDKSYLPKPARREYIAKKNSNKKRPLGIQSGNDKLVQEVVKMILESIYEPVPVSIKQMFTKSSADIVLEVCLQSHTIPEQEGKSRPFTETGLSEKNQLRSLTM